MVAHLRMPVVSQQGQRWIDPEKARYYRVVLEQDLFGVWSLIACWGGLHSRRGGMRVTTLASLDAGVAALDGIAKRRRQRGYVPMPPPPDPSA